MGVDDNKQQAEKPDYTSIRVVVRVRSQAGRRAVLAHKPTNSIHLLNHGDGPFGVLGAPRKPFTFDAVLDDASHAGVF